ncbi:MAG TPA: AGE family epimerase/isomerase [Gemmatimonadota bacterium]|nr:AGE family epimerase/isomerase [Gemmatimonadota bacterium]
MPPDVDPLARVRGTAPRLENILTTNIDPFWSEGTLDHENGGYRINHDSAGAWRGPAPKRTVSQVRSLWYFSRMHRAGYEGTHREAARHGFEFLAERLWDHDHGGVYWEVDAAGREPTIADKHLFAQAFALFALAEYARTTGDASARALADRLFEVTEERHHDPRHGGYREHLARDGSELPSGTPNLMNPPVVWRTMNTHLHVMEALNEYYPLSKDSLVRERLIEMTRIMTSAVIRKRHAAGTNAHYVDWIPLVGHRTTVSYGHDIENVHLLIVACEALGWPQAPFIDLYVSLFETALIYGRDRRAGGFFLAGWPGLPAHRREKVFWVQAEILLGCARMLHLTGHDIYAETFLETLGWIENRQVDWERGEWHLVVETSGRATGDKAGLWKEPYHHGRAMIECLELMGRGFRNPARSGAGRAPS